MTKHPQLRRILVALIISGLLNGILLLLDIFTGSVLSKTAEILLSPGGAVTKRLVPVGHDTAHFLLAIAVSIASSVIFYMLVAWIILTTWARARHHGPGESGSISISG